MKKVIAAAIALLGFGIAPGDLKAQERYIGDIFMGGWNFCPRGSLPANGQLLAISTNTALFSLLGTAYGGDGRTSFALPDLRGRSPLALGTGPGLTTLRLGDRGGRENVTLTNANLPSHSHSATSTAHAAAAPSSAPAPAGNLLAIAPQTPIYAPPSAATLQMHPGMVETTVQNTGGSQAFEIRDPYLAIQFCVATQGIFPSRN